MPLTYEEEVLIGLLGDVVDGLEAFQAIHQDPFIENQLSDIRYVRSRWLRSITLAEQLRAPSARPVTRET
jgi:hypothetical protein